jgi:hypothetical protein
MGLGAVAVVDADEVEDSISEALEYYKEGDFSSAAGSLEYAAQLIRQKKGGQLEEFLPKALPGWKAEEATSQAMGAAMFGGGVTAERRFTKGGSEISVQMVTDSPVMQGMMVLFTNPMFAASDGGKMEKIKRQKAIVKYDPDTREGDIKIMVANRFLVTVEGRSVSKQDLQAYAQAIDYKKLAAMP